MKIKISTYDDFVENQLKDAYDFVLMIFMDEVSGDDMEIQADHYNYYASVPIVHWCISDKKVYQSRSYDELRSFIKDNLE